MAQCDIQTLLDDARCLSTLNPSLLRVVTAQLWCQVAEGISVIVSDNPAIQNIDDGEWYRLNGVELGVGDAIISVGQVPTDPGVNAYLVLVNLTDGLKYKLRLAGAAPDIFWDTDGVATGEAATPTVIVASGNNYDLNFVTDGGLTLRLTPV